MSICTSSPSSTTFVFLFVSAFVFLFVIFVSRMSIWTSSPSSRTFVMNSMERSQWPEHNDTMASKRKHNSNNSKHSSSDLFNSQPFSCKSLPSLVRNLPQIRRTWTENKSFRKKQILSVHRMREWIFFNQTESTFQVSWLGSGKNKTH